MSDTVIKLLVALPILNIASMLIYATDPEEIDKLWNTLPKIGKFIVLMLVGWVPVLFCQLVLGVKLANKFIKFIHIKKKQCSHCGSFYR